MPPAARISDMHTCPMVTGNVPHVGGPIITGEPTVIIGSMPAARVTDQCTCVGPTDVIVRGSMTVYIGYQQAARIGDMTAHGGVIVQGLPTVIIGDTGSAAPGGPRATGGVTGATGGADTRERPVFGQEEPMSCGMAATRMVIFTQTGWDVSEAALRQESQRYPGAYDPVNGTRMDNLVRLLRANGVNASDYRGGQTLDNLAQDTARGDPAIAHFNNPGHFVVVDGVRTNADGSRTVLVRDPWPQGTGAQREMSEADFNSRFSGHTIATGPSP